MGKGCLFQFTYCAQEECTRFTLLNNYKQNMLSLSLLAGRTVAMIQIRDWSMIYLDQLTAEWFHKALFSQSCASPEFCKNQSLTQSFEFTVQYNLCEMSTLK